ncbi:MAG: type II secretion system protein N [Candidatus Competibacterales bacterium]
MVLGRWLVVLGVLVFGGSTLTLLPAAWIADHLEQRFPALTVGVSRGTLGGGELRNIQLADGRLDAVGWRWQPTELFAAALGFAIDAQGPELAFEGRVALGPTGELTLSHWRGRAALGQLLALAGQPAALVAAQVVFDLDRIQLAAHGAPLDARGEVELRAVQTRLGDPLPLGDFALALEGGADDGSLRGNLRDLGGPLALTGHLTLERSGRYRVEATLRAREQADPKLKQLIPLLAPPQPDGSTVLRHSGQWAR